MDESRPACPLPMPSESRPRQFPLASLFFIISLGPLYLSAAKAWGVFGDAAETALAVAFGVPYTILMCAGRTILCLRRPSCRMPWETRLNR
jgi:hypothetical protein